MVRDEKIDFISIEGQIEETSGRRRFYLQPEKKIHDYEKRMLCDSHCPYTLPMYFLTEDGTETAYYDFTGYLQSGDYIRKNAAYKNGENSKQICDALNLLSGTLESIKGMENYLLFPERVSTHPDAIFVHLNTDRVAFAYYPNDQAEMTLQSRIIQLTEKLIELYRDAETEQHLMKYIRTIHMKNPGLDGMISILGTIQRETAYIYWSAKDLRNTAEKETQYMNEAPAAEEKKKAGWIMNRFFPNAK